MTTQTTTFGAENPLTERYASREIQNCFSRETKYGIWRRIWVALAEAEKEVGIGITAEQIAELKAHQNTIDFEAVARYEAALRHDVMAHVHAYGDLCPSARKIIHLGATSATVQDNADIIQMQAALEVVLSKLVNVIHALREFAVAHADMPTVGFTHLQYAQPLTVGKRATLWLSEFVMDYHALVAVKKNLKLRGLKGTTGTQASFLTLLSNDSHKVQDLEKRFIAKLGFSDAYAVTGQTVSRKVDADVLHVLAQIAASASKFSNDLRYLQSIGELEEPIGKSQIGSSAMPYKRNPMTCERIGSLSRYAITLAVNPLLTASAQFLERTLDDSANRRLVVMDSFLTTDAVLKLVHFVASGIVVYPHVIRDHLNEALPSLISETLMMEASKMGVDRQVAHEHIRKIMFDAKDHYQKTGVKTDVIERLRKDELFNGVNLDWTAMMDHGQYTGRSKEQVREFIASTVDPILKQNQNRLGLDSTVHV